MSESPATSQPLASGHEAAGVTVDELSSPSLAPAWVRPVAAIATVVAAAIAAWTLAGYFRTYGSLFAALDTPPIAVALVFAVVAVMALAVVVLRPERGTLRAQISLSAVWSLAILAALVLAWGAVALSGREDRWNGTLVTSLPEAEAYLAAHLPPRELTVQIPTGVLVKSMEFLNGDNVQVTGFLWQRFDESVPEELTRGFALGEAVREAFDAKEVYRTEENGVETIGWYFAATLRQPFEYDEFPLDQQNMRLRIWPIDLSRDVVFVPDFGAYVSLDPESLPGIQAEFVYTGWSPIYSGFSYTLQDYTTSLGVGEVGQESNPPELNFNLILDRNFAGPFVEHIVFALAVAMLLFVLLTLTTSDEDLKSRFNMSAAAILGSASGLLFAVILKHNQVRTAVGSQGVAYIEAIPIILYLAIVLVVVNAILLASPLNLRFVEHRNNLLPNLAFWPAILGMLLAATLLVLFRV